MLSPVLDDLECNLGSTIWRCSLFVLIHAIDKLGAIYRSHLLWEVPYVVRLFGLDPIQLIWMMNEFEKLDPK